MITVLRQKLVEVLKAVAPLIVVISLLQVLFVHAPLGSFVQFMAGAALATVGMLLLLWGIDLGIVPMGRFIGAELPVKGALTPIIAVAFAIAFATTVAEPDVLVLGSQVDEATRGAISKWTIVLVIAVGLAAFAAFAMARVIAGWPMRYLLTAAYALMIGLAFAAPPDFISLSFDAGSVTTGVLSSPAIIALAIGVSSVLAGRSTVADGFGLLGFASIGAIIAVLVMGIVTS